MITTYKLRYYAAQSPVEFINLPRRRLYRSNPLFVDLIAAYLFNEYDGDRFDSYINDLHLTDGNSVESEVWNIGRQIVIQKSESQTLTRSNALIAPLQMGLLDMTFTFVFTPTISAEKQGIISLGAVTDGGYSIEVGDAGGIKVVIDTGGSKRQVVVPDGTLSSGVEYFTQVKFDRSGDMQVDLNLTTAKTRDISSFEFDDIQSMDDFQVGLLGTNYGDFKMAFLLIHGRLTTVEEDSFLYNVSSYRPWSQIRNYSP